MRGHRAMLAMAVVGALAGAFTAACGEDDDGGAERPPPVARPQDFPGAAGKTLAQLRREVGQSGPVLSPSVSQFEPGTNRFGFGLFDRAKAQIGDAAAAVYVAPTRGGVARGPFPARYESLEVKPRFQSRTVSADPDSAKSVYVADLDFDRPGQYEVMGLVRLDNRLVAATPAGPPLRVMEGSRVPEVGDPAPRTSTPTEASVGGDIDQIETRMPPDSMHEADFAKVVGRKPVILLFSTPQLCQSRVCGPVVDIAEQVKAEGGDKAAFIHMEIYNDNTVERGFRPQVARWRLPTEPWLFAIDRRGRVAARIEGAFSARELERAVAAAERGARPGGR